VVAATNGENAALSYEEAVRVWASRKFDIDLDRILSVDFEIRAGGSCPTCGPEVDASVEVRVRRPEQRVPEGLHVYAFDHYDLGGLIREVLACATPPGREVD
jgi:hypothetical protein